MTYIYLYRKQTLFIITKRVVVYIHVKYIPAYREVKKKRSCYLSTANLDTN